jgi:hypothetical protein
VAVHVVGDDGQSESAAGVGVAAAGVQAAGESLEDAFAQGGWDAAAGVVDDDPRPGSAAVDGDRDRAATVVAGVVEQVGVASRDRAKSQTSSASRVLPTPGSPESSVNPPRPATASSTARRSVFRTCSLPTRTRRLPASIPSIVPPDGPEPNRTDGCMPRSSHDVSRDVTPLGVVRLTEEVRTMGGFRSRVLRLVIVLAVVLCPMILAPVIGQAGDRWLELSPREGPPGTVVTVLGHGFPYGDCAAYAVLWWAVPKADNIEKSVDPYDRDPSFVAEMPVPSGAKPDNVTMESSCGAWEFAKPGPSAHFRVVIPVSSTSPAARPSSSSRPSPSTTSSPVHSSSPAPASTGKSRPGAPTVTRPAVGGPTRTSDEPGSDTGHGSPSRPSSVVAHPGGSPVAGAAGGSSAWIRPVRMTGTLPATGELRFSLAVALALAGLVALLIVLIAFPAELFNKTYEENKTEIHRILRIRGRHFPPWLGVFVFVLVSAVLSAMLANGEGAAGNPLAQVLAFVVAVPIVTFAYCLPGELLSRRWSRVQGYLQLLPSAMLVAVVCAGLSWLLELDPPYVYGLFAGFVTMPKRRLTDPEEGRAVLSGAVSLVVIGAAAWLVWPPAHAAAHGPTPTLLAVFADAALFWVFVLAAESLVFALMPLRFLDGEKLKKWRLVSWLVPQVLAVSAFGYLLVLRSGMNPPGGGVTAVLKALVFFVVFGLLSVGFWRYFCWTGRPTRPLAAEPR